MRRGKPSKADEYTPTGELYLGSLIRSLRLQQGLEITVMATRVGCSPFTLKRLEINFYRPSLEMLTKIASALHISVRKLQAAPLHPRIEPKQTTGSSPKGPSNAKETRLVVARIEKNTHVLAQAMLAVCLCLSGSGNKDLLEQAIADLRAILPEETT